jgi:hypothetical protein
MSERWAAVVRASCLIALINFGLGCGGDDDDTGPNTGDPDDFVPGGTGAPCSFNTSFSCVGRGNCSGVRLCGDDNRFTDCICDETPLIDAGALDGATAVPDASDTADASSQDAGTHDAGPRPPVKDEICDNSKDDDEDGDIDCADSDCGARLCAPKAPTGWTGPTLRYVGDDPPDCSGTYPDEVAQGGTVAAAGDADCSTCSCATPTIACASVLDFQSGADAACGGVSCTASVTTTCSELSCPYLGATSGYIASAKPSGLAECSPSEQTPSVDDAAEWSDRMIACAPDTSLRQGGCAEGEVCAPKTPFDGEICIVKKGDHTCPAGQYSNRHVYFTRIEDTRSCSDCACGHDCTYKWQIFAAADTTCTGTPVAPTELTAENQCIAVTPAAGKLPVRAQVTGTGACTPSGGEPTGSVSGANAITVCCVD